MCDRFYSEQYGLAMYLLANPDKYQTILPNYFISEDKELSGLFNWSLTGLRRLLRNGQLNNSITTDEMRNACL